MARQNVMRGTIQLTRESSKSSHADSLSQADLDAIVLGGVYTRLWLFYVYVL